MPSLFAYSSPNLKQKHQGPSLYHQFHELM